VEGIHNSCQADKSEIDMERQMSKFKIQNSNEKGIALVMVLLLSVMALAIMAALIYMLTAGTQISGAQKRYKTALEAGIGGSDIIYQVIAARIDNPDTLENDFNFLSNIDVPTSQACLKNKLLLATGSWASCAADATTMTIDPTDNATYDMMFDIGAETPYRVYAKIVDTIPGNSGGDVGLTKGGALESAGAQVVSKPFFYTIEINAETRDNPVERAKLSILYEY